MNKHFALTVLLLCQMLLAKGQDSKESSGQSKPLVLADSIFVVNGIAFMPDSSQIFISNWVNETERNGKRGIKIFVYDYVEGKLINNRTATFCSGLSDYHPVISPDAKKIFFNSRRPIPNSDSLNSVVHIWYVERVGEVWSEAKYLSDVNITGIHCSYPSITKKGALYVNSNRTGGQGGMDLYKSEFMNGTYQAPENLATLNSTASENDLIVDPDERFIIFNRWYEKDNSMHMFISVNSKNGWQSPRSIDAINEDNVWELTPSLSPDGRYFLYERRGLIMIIPLVAILDDNEKKILGLK